MKVLGAVGRVASGKDALIERLQQKYAVPTVSIGGQGMYLPNSLFSYGIFLKGFGMSCHLLL